ncbi:MAG: hypothetical protein QOE35_3097 [Actinomycetota bacterium]|jgi:hypothetical protein
MRRILAGMCVSTVALLCSAAGGGAAWAGTGTGYDVSFPQCGGAYPAKPAFGIVGVGGGKAFTHNSCLASEYAWAAGATKPAAFYMNTGNPGTLSTRWTLPGPSACSGSSSDSGCAYNYGWNNAADALTYASQQTSSATAAARAWWLDVETANSWSTNTGLNVTTLQGSVDYLRAQGVTVVGMYSTTAMWKQITGGAAMPVPAWVAGASTKAQAKSFCGKGFTGGGVRLVQFPSGGFDGDVAC